jgi:hypothetical protein
MLTEQQIHYYKANIRDFKERDRIKVNMDIVNRDGNNIKTTWRLTQERREIYNSLQDAEDEGWQCYDEYVDIWKQIRKEHGQGVKLWIGKLGHRVKWSYKETQNIDRVPFAVGLLMLNRKTQQLYFQFTIDGWTQNIELQTIEDAQYNRVYTWQNPLSSIIGRRTRRLF